MSESESEPSLAPSLPGRRGSRRLGGRGHLCVTEEGLAARRILVASRFVSDLIPLAAAPRPNPIRTAPPPRPVELAGELEGDVLPPALKVPVLLRRGHPLYLTLPPRS